MQKRKVDNLTALAVLSVVQERPMHRYEMAKVMRERSKDQDMAVKWGSLYTVVQNMEKHGLLEATGVDRQGSRPERTIYRITDAGRREMIEWTEELVSTPHVEHPKFAAGLSMLAALGPDDATAALTRRLDALEQRAATSSHTSPDIPRLFLIEDEYATALLQAEISWVRSLLTELTDGTFPGLDVWATYYDERGRPTAED